MLAIFQQAYFKPNKSLKQENIQLAVFTAFNILANYKFPLNEALASTEGKLEPFGSILGALGSVASLISLYFCWKISEKWWLRISLFLVFILAGLSSYFSYQYYESTKPEVVRQNKQKELRLAVKEFINGTSFHASYYEPGESEGIINSGLIILEQYKELYLDQYERIKNGIESELKRAKEIDDRQSIEYRDLMKQTGKSMGVTLEKLAGAS